MIPKERDPARKKDMGVGRAEKGGVESNLGGEREIKGRGYAQECF